MSNYCLPDTYTARQNPEYFNDTLADANLWQADVYRLAAILARKAGVKRIVDIGCGRAGKLLQLADEFDIIGYDHGGNILYCKEQYSGANAWYNADLNEDILESGVDIEYFSDSLVICADVIEHLTIPNALIQTLRNASKRAAYVLVSTPDRNRLYGYFHHGPPDNKAHVREWTNAELERWFQAEGLPIVWCGWTVSYDKQPEKRNTSLIILSKEHSVGTLPRQYEPVLSMVYP